MKKIGTSMVMCLCSIAQGTTKIEDVEFIMSARSYPDREAFMEDLASVLVGRYVDKMVQIAGDLWDDGRIMQCSVHQNDRVVRPDWIEVPKIFYSVTNTASALNLHRNQGVDHHA